MVSEENKKIHPKILFQLFNRRKVEPQALVVHSKVLFTVTKIEDSFPSWAKMGKL